MLNLFNSVKLGLLPSDGLIEKRIDNSEAGKRIGKTGRKKINRRHLGREIKKREKERRYHRPSIHHPAIKSAME